MATTRFRISPLIRYSLYSLYLALTLPLPFLISRQVRSSGALFAVVLALVIGWVILIGALSQRVDVGDTTLRVSYPGWVPSWFQQGWQCPWVEIASIETTSTSQGGLAYYLVTPSQERYLLPMRIRGFRRLLKLIQEKTGHDTTSVYPYVQPWMYAILAVCAGLILLSDLVVIGLTLTMPPLTL